MKNAARTVTAGAVAGWICLLTGPDAAAPWSQQNVERTLDVLAKPNALNTVQERSDVIAEIKRSVDLREDERVRLALIAALDSGKDEYFASWLADDPSYTEAQGEALLMVLEAVISLRDVRAIPALVESADNGPIVWQALAGFGDLAVDSIVAAWNARIARPVHPTWRGRGLINALSYIVSESSLRSESLARIHDVARSVLDKPRDSYDLVNAMELAVALQAPDLVAQVEAIARDPRGELELRGIIVNSQRAATVRRYAREDLAKLAR